jgi:hypothetical protein
MGPDGENVALLLSYPLVIGLIIVVEDPAVSSDRSNSGRWNHGFLKH